MSDNAPQPEQAGMPEPKPGQLFCGHCTNKLSDVVLRSDYDALRAACESLREKLVEATHALGVETRRRLAAEQSAQKMAGALRDAAEQMSFKSGSKTGNWARFQAWKERHKEAIDTALQSGKGDQDGKA